MTSMYKVGIDTEDGERFGVYSDGTDLFAMDIDGLWCPYIYIGGRSTFHVFTAWQPLVLTLI